MIQVCFYEELEQVFYHFPKYHKNNLLGDAENNIGDHHCGFRRNRSTTDRIFCIRQILEKK
jgi:hypothetical protein